MFWGVGPRLTDLGRCPKHLTRNQSFIRAKVAYIGERYHGHLVENYTLTFQVIEYLAISGGPLSTQWLGNSKVTAQGPGYILRARNGRTKGRGEGDSKVLGVVGLTDRKM